MDANSDEMSKKKHIDPDVAEYEAAEITPEAVREALIKLKSLEDHNAKHRRRHTLGSEVVLTGIACPKCGAELQESNPGRIHPSLPPQKAVKCTKCEYLGTCIA